MDAAEREAWRLENFASSYRAWLLDLMGAFEHEILFDVLYGIEFTWPDDIPRDGDRAAAGQDLRLEFAHISGMACDDEWVDWPCSMLEMLVGLARSMEDRILYDGSVGDRTSEWFWMMMRNCGLDICDDEFMVKTGPRGTQYVYDIADNIIFRRYDRLGNGGLFPLWESEKDQRTVEIWYQANAYILENELA